MLSKAKSSEVQLTGCVGVGQGYAAVIERV